MVPTFEEIFMHASTAYLNGAGAQSRDIRQLELLNALLCGTRAEGPSVDNRKPLDQKKAEEELDSETVSQPGGFKNDPDVPTNPNEARERHLKKVNR
jgi:hypothetical protein